MGTSRGNLGRSMYSDPLWRASVSHGKQLKRAVVCKECPKCHTTFEITRSVDKHGVQKYRKKEKQFCSRGCANGHEHTPEWKEHISQTLSKPLVRNLCLQCGVEFYRGKHQKYCSRECVNLSRRLNLMPKRQYRLACRFTFSLANFPDKFDFSLIKQYGWYKAKNRGNNLDGISRDHMYSINDGFKNGVSSKILSHPANCKLLRHSENLIKMTKSSITLDELKDRIKTW
jgi:hypothetical protein